MVARILVFLSLSFCFVESVEAFHNFLKLQDLASLTDNVLALVWYIGLCMGALAYGMLCYWTFKKPTKVLHFRGYNVQTGESPTQK